MPNCTQKICVEIFSCQCNVLRIHLNWDRNMFLSVPNTSIFWINFVPWIQMKQKKLVVLSVKYSSIVNVVHCGFPFASSVEVRYLTFDSNDLLLSIEIKLNPFISTVLIELKKRKQTAQMQLQKSDDKENVTVNKIGATNLIEQKKEANKRNRARKKQCNSAKNLETSHKTKDELKINNKENAAVNIIEATDLCIEMTESKKSKNQREMKTAHSTRYKPSINHMPGIDHKTRVRCKFEGCQLTSNCYCMECGVHLCIKSDPGNTQEKNCFFKYHTLPK